MRSASRSGKGSRAARAATRGSHPPRLAAPRGAAARASPLGLSRGTSPVRRGSWPRGAVGPAGRFGAGPGGPHRGRRGRRPRQPGAPGAPGAPPRPAKTAEMARRRRGDLGRPVPRHAIRQQTLDIGRRRGWPRRGSWPPPGCPPAPHAVPRPLPPPQRSARMPGGKARNRCAAGGVRDAGPRRVRGCGSFAERARRAAPSPMRARHRKVTGRAREPGGPPETSWKGCLPASGGMARPAVPRPWQEMQAPRRPRRSLPPASVRRRGMPPVAGPVGHASQPLARSPHRLPGEGVCPPAPGVERPSLERGRRSGTGPARPPARNPAASETAAPNPARRTRIQGGSPHFQGRQGLAGALPRANSLAQGRVRGVGSPTFSLGRSSRASISRYQQDPGPRSAPSTPWESSRTPGQIKQALASGAFTAFSRSSSPGRGRLMAFTPLGPVLPQTRGRLPPFHRQARRHQRLVDHQDAGKDPLLLGAFHHPLHIAELRRGRRTTAPGGPRSRRRRRCRRDAEGRRHLHRCGSGSAREATLQPSRGCAITHSGSSPADQPRLLVLIQRARKFTCSIHEVVAGRV